MSDIHVAGWGAVSPAGWGVNALVEASEANVALPTSRLEHPGLSTPIVVRRVPPRSPRPHFMAHPRLRRASPISQHATAAVLEALDAMTGSPPFSTERLAIIFTAMTGCVVYSQRFYAEVLEDPSTASPIIFPETVFNAPASHLSAFLGTRAINYTLVGDPSTFVQGLALAASWLTEKRVDACVVAGAEELAWPVAGAQRLFDKHIITSEGAGALLLTRSSGSKPRIRLDLVTNPIPYNCGTSRHAAARSLRKQFGTSDAETVLCDSRTGARLTDAPECSAWNDWTGPRVSIKQLLGESYAAGSAWQCVLAADRLATGRSTTAIVSVVGCNQQAIGAQFSGHRD